MPDTGAPKKILCFAPFSRWCPHLETDLELAEKHLVQGDQVTWFGCDRDLETCEINPDHGGKLCAQCVGRRNAGFELLSGRVEYERHTRYLTHEDRARIAGLPTAFRDALELKALELDGFDLGYATLSSVVWVARDADVDLSSASPYLARFLRSAAGVYLAMRRYLAEHPVDRVYVFNGRISAMRGMLRAAQERDIPVFVHERGSVPTKYSLTPNAMPHEIQAITQRIDAAWGSEQPELEEKQRLAAAWYEGRAKGRVDQWYAFTDKQQAGSLPPDWDATRHNVALYPSSEHEFAAIGKEWQSPLFEVPTEGVARIAESVSRAGRVHLTIRMHPNPEGMGNTSAARLLSIDLPHVTVVPAESSVCSYALLQAADKVVVTSSTVGIEATFWGKPAIQAGRSLYSNLGATHQPTTYEALLEAIHDTSLAPVEREPALRYGYYQAIFGEPFQHFEPQGLFDGSFKGTRIEPRGLDRLRTRVYRLGERARGLISKYGASIG